MFTGCRQTDIVDPDGDISFPVMTLYPTAEPATKVAFGPYEMDLAMNAAIVPRACPVVVISHGSGGSHLAYRSYGQYLVEQGFVVCLPEHPGDNRRNKELAGTRENMIQRPRHIRMVIDSLLHDAFFAGALQPQSAVVVGHSLGGYTAMAVAGGVPDPQFQIRVEKHPDVRAIVLLDPSGVEFFDWEGGFTELGAAIKLLCAGPVDGAVQETISMFSSRIAAHQTFEHRVFDNAGHYSFLSPFPDALKNRVGPAAQDPEGFDRVAFHKQINLEITEFLRNLVIR